MAAPLSIAVDPAAAAPSLAAAVEARLLIEDQLQMLRRVAQVGLEVALEVERQARGEVPEGQKPAAIGDVALAYARASRAMRLTVMLQSRLLKDLHGLDGAAADAEAGAEAKAQAEVCSLEQARKGSVERIVGRVAEADGQDESQSDELVLRASERLEDDDIYGDVLARPVSEIVADICADLGLRPDWPRLSTEAWAQAEMAGAGAGAPLAGLPHEGRLRRPPPPPFHPLRAIPPRRVSVRPPDGAEADSGPTEIKLSWLPPEPAPLPRPLPPAEEGDREGAERGFGGDSG